jgi:hypothetical protein
MAARLAALLLTGHVMAGGMALAQGVTPAIPPPRPSDGTAIIVPGIPPPTGAQPVDAAPNRPLGPEDAAEVRALCRVAPDWRVFPLCHRLRGTN